MYARQYLQREMIKEALPHHSQGNMSLPSPGEVGGSKAKIDYPKRTTELIRVTCELNFY